LLETLGVGRRKLRHSSLRPLDPIVFSGAWHPQMAA
jgi:hypothetical protein